LVGFCFSSTAASVHLRIARNLAWRLQRTKVNTRLKRVTDHGDDNDTQKQLFDICRTRHLHGWANARMYHFGSRNRTASFLWSMVRDPTPRYISEFFHFEVSRKRNGSLIHLDRHFIQYLQHGPHANHHSLNWLSTTLYHFNRTDPIKTANQILLHYDFLGVTERFDESMVALALITNTPIRDILYLSSKNNGAYDDGAYRNQCTKIISGHLTPTMQSYLDSVQWQYYISPEWHLYRAVNRSLDLTIDYGIVGGRSRFNDALHVFRMAQRSVEANCSSTVRFPCTGTGQRRNESDTDCLWSDIGCGFDCIDQVANSIGLPIDW
jgi:hypothetical protein